MKRIKKKILIFDLDGVLIDSKKNMFLSWLKVQEKHNLSSINFKQYFKNIGRPFFDILKIIGVKNNFQQISNTYSNESFKQKNHIKFYENTPDILRELKRRKFKLNIVTSKDIKRTREFLKKNLKYFSYIQCDNNKIKGKPNPDHIDLIISKLKAEKHDCVYIGDTQVDYLTAKNSKIDFIFAEWGYGRNYNYKYKCKKISQLLKMIDY